MKHWVDVAHHVAHWSPSVRSRCGPRESRTLGPDPRPGATALGAAFIVYAASSMYAKELSYHSTVITVWTLRAPFVAVIVAIPAVIPVITPVKESTVTTVTSLLVNTARNPSIGAKSLSPK